MKKTLVMFLVSLSMVSAVHAAVKTIKNATTDEPVFFKFEKDDGLFFLLGPESPNKLIIHVAKVMSDGHAPDLVTLSCNSTLYYMKPDETVTCYGNFEDVSWMTVESANFKYGAEGTYQFVPVSEGR
jgi:hypothetical protein